MDRPMHTLLQSFDRWQAELEGQLPALDDQARAFLAWELRRAAEAIEQAGGYYTPALTEHPVVEAPHDMHTEAVRERKRVRPQTLAK
jgi:hypothetical protein